MDHQDLVVYREREHLESKEIKVIKEYKEYKVLQVHKVELEKTLLYQDLLVNVV